MMCTAPRDPALTAAEHLVVTDQRAGYPEMCATEAIANARNTIRLPEDEFVPGTISLDEDGSRLAKAYRLVLEGDSDCEGHESLRGDMMGTTDYCDGSCRLA